MMAQKSHRRNYKCSSTNIFFDFSHHSCINSAHVRITYAKCSTLCNIWRLCAVWCAYCVCFTCEATKTNENSFFKPWITLALSLSLSARHGCHSSNFAFLWGRKIIAWFLISHFARCEHNTYRFSCCVFDLCAGTIAAYWIQNVAHNNADNVQSSAQIHHTRCAAVLPSPTHWIAMPSHPSRPGWVCSYSRL